MSSENARSHLDDFYRGSVKPAGREMPPMGTSLTATRRARSRPSPEDLELGI